MFDALGLYNCAVIESLPLIAGLIAAAIAYRAPRAGHYSLAAVCGLVVSFESYVAGVFHLFDKGPSTMQSRRSRPSVDPWCAQRSVNAAAVPLFQVRSADYSAARMAASGPATGSTTPDSPAASPPPPPARPSRTPARPT